MRSRQSQQYAADYTTQCQLGTEVTLVLLHLSTNLLDPLSFGLVSATWFPPSVCLCLASSPLFCSYCQLHISITSVSFTVWLGFQSSVLYTVSLEQESMRMHTFPFLISFLSFFIFSELFIQRPSFIKSATEFMWWFIKYCFLSDIRDKYTLETFNTRSDV